MDESIHNVSLANYLFSKYFLENIPLLKGFKNSINI